MKNLIFCDFWGVPKEICGNGDRIDGVKVYPFLEDLSLVPIEDGENVVVATMTNGGLNPDFYNLLLKKEKKLGDLGVKIKGRADNKFTLNYDGADGVEFGIIQNRERDYIYNIYSNIYNNIQYNMGNGKIRVISTNFLSLSDLSNFVIKIRYLVKRYGEELFSSFIPKPFAKSEGVGFVLSFFVEGEKKTLDRFLAGILLHAPEYAVFTNISENSYLRLGGRECAHYVCWGETDDVLLKVKERDGGREITLSFPDATGNPYILLSALLEGGIMGIEGGNKLPDKVFELTPAVQKDLVRMPLSLSDALNLATNSGFCQRVLGEGLARVFYKFVTEEIEDFKGITTEDEYFKKYSEIL